MEEKKFDINTVVGFLLIGAILLYMLWQNQPTPEQLEAQKAEKEKIEQIEIDNKISDKVSQQDISLENAMTTFTIANSEDSLGLSELQNRLGSFAYSGTLPSATEATTVIENEVLKLTISNKGGYIVEAKLKEQAIFKRVI